jgi:hypothetical protein
VDVAVLVTSFRERVPEAVARERLAAGVPRAHAEFRLALAWAITRLLRDKAPEISDVHVTGSTLTEDTGPYSDLDLVLRVPHVYAATRAVVEDVNAAVTRAYRAIVPSVPDAFKLLDVKYVTLEDAAVGSGVASVLTGSNAPVHTPTL